MTDINLVAEYSWKRDVSCDGTQDMNLIRASSTVISHSQPGSTRFLQRHIILRSDSRSQNTASCIMCRIALRQILSFDRHESMVLSAMSKRR